MGKKAPETAGETAQKKPRGIEKVKKTVKKFKDRIKSVLGRSAEEEKFHEEAWNKFPEEAKKEMQKSLAMRRKFKWSKKDVHALAERINGDLTFKKGIVKKDEIGNYIEINGMKCREYQPGISGFVYKNISEEYKETYKNRRLVVGFCDKGNFISKKLILDPKKPGIIDFWLSNPEEPRDDSSHRNASGTKISTEDTMYPDYATSSGIREIRKKEGTW